MWLVTESTMKKTLFLVLALWTGTLLQAQEYRFNTKADGFSVKSKSNTTLSINYNVSGITLENADREGLEGQIVTLSGIHISNEAGAPNLPSRSTFVAIPNGAKSSIKMVNARTKTIKNVDLIPAPQPQLDNNDSPAVYQKDMSIYGRNALYPATPFHQSEIMTLRGIQMVQIGVMPFQYNPVTKDLIVYESLELELTTEGGDGTYGDIRFRTPEWDHILGDILLNREVLPKVDYGKRLRKHYENRETGYEYVIITPDNADFIQLADSIKKFRTNQGIPTGVFTVTECGGNDSQAIKDFIDNAYFYWDMPPAAVLILGDHNSDPSKGVVSHPMYNHPGGNSYNPYISDHAYAVMTDTHMPEIIMARITGRNFDELYHMIKKDLDYERTPPTNPTFYDKPVTAMGFQLERWFQLCSEVVNGFWEYGLGKHPVRINAIYEGTPGRRWSTYEYTNTVLNYFGPNGCNYIPSTMSHLTDWSGTGDMINEAINNGAFIVQHRDHGSEELWGEPRYSIGNIKRLTNEDLTYVMSNNCLTGRFNYNGQDGCFTEAFHRHQHGALGLIAATQVSYSFVNDIYVWGAYDNMWPDFLPSFGSEYDENFILPAFGNAAGKYFLSQSSWTNSSVKEITYYLFHQHGDAYMNLYSEMPQNLDVEMLPVLVAGSGHYQLKVDAGSTICLTANGQIIGFGIGTGNTQNITVTPQEIGTRVHLTIRKQNYYRYEHDLATIPEGEPYLIFNSIGINDDEGNANQEADYNETCQLSIGLRNVGATGIEQVNASLVCEHPSVQIIKNDATYSSIESGGTLEVNDAFTVQFGDDIIDGESIPFHIIMSDGTKTFIDSVSIKVNAPVLRYGQVTYTNLDGEDTERVMPGTTTLINIAINNDGHSRSLEQIHELSLRVPYLNIAEAAVTVPAIDAGSASQVTFRIDASDVFTSNLFDCSVQAESGSHSASLDFKAPYYYTIEDFEDNELNPSLKWSLGTGSKKWHIVENEIDGHVMSSPDINKKVSKKLYISLTCHQGLSFSFRHKVASSETDTLSVYVNKVEKAKWSGGSDWETSEIPLDDGSNLIMFVFSRGDGAVVNDSCAYLDDLLLPPLEELLVFAGDDSIMCQTPSYSPNSYAYHQSDILWSTNGDGSFDDPSLETPLYTFGPNDLANRTVTLNMKGTSLLNKLQDSTQVNLYLIEDLTSIQDLASPVGDTLIDLRLVTQSEYHFDTIVPGEIIWILEPEQAGVLAAENDHATVLWNNDFRGEAQLSYKFSNECGESDPSETLNIAVVNSTSTEEISDQQLLSVYPNPANDKIDIKIHSIQEGQVVIRVIDPLGRIVFVDQKSTASGSLEESLNTTALRSGLYDLQVIDGNRIHNARIIIKK